MKKSCLLLIVIVLCACCCAQEAIVAPNQNLILENIPPVPASIAERADRYTQYRMAEMFGWQPQRREILIGTRFGDTQQVHSVAMPMGARTQMTFFADRVQDASYPRLKANHFLFRKDVGGGEWYQIYRFDVASGDTTILTDGKSRNTEFVWSNRDDRIAYASTRRNGADLDFYVMNPVDKSSDKLLTQNQGGGWQVFDWSPDDRSLLTVEFVSINESHLWLVDVASGAKSELTPSSGEKVFYAPVGFSRDGKGIYVVTDKDSEFQRLAYMDLASRQLKFLTNYSWDIEDGAQIAPNRQMIAFALNENGLSSLHVLELSTGKERKMPKIPVGVIDHLSWHENNQDLAFDLDSAQSPVDVYSVDVQTAKLERWTANETGGLNPKSFVDPALVKWKSFDGREISGWLYLPKTKPDRASIRWLS